MDLQVVVHLDLGALAPEAFEQACDGLGALGLAAGAGRGPRRLEGPLPRAELFHVRESGGGHARAQAQYQRLVTDWLAARALAAQPQVWVVDEGHRDGAGRLAPPWVARPRFPRSSAYWRQGGESLLRAFLHAWRKLDAAGRAQLRQAYPELWEGFYDDMELLA
jgi:hypothetical protein